MHTPIAQDVLSNVASSAAHAAGITELLQCAQGAPFLLAQLLQIVQTADASAPEVPRHALSILSSLLGTLFSITEGMRMPDGTDTLVLQGVRPPP